MQPSTQYEAEAPVYVAEAPAYVAEAQVYVAEAPPTQLRFQSQLG